MSDLELWQKFKSGDDSALDEIVKLYGEQLYYYGIHFGMNEELVKDAIQNIFVYLMEKRNNLGATDNIKFYLFVCLKREITKQQIFKSKTSLVDDNTSFNFGSNFQFTSVDLEEYEVSKQSEILKLQKHLGDLSPGQREIIYLLYYKNFSVDEISSILGITTRTIYNQTQKAMVTLRGKMTS